MKPTIRPISRALLGVFALGLCWSHAEEKKNNPQAKPPAKASVTDFTKVPPGWLTGLDRAKELAASTGRDLLLNFGATDWIPPSIDLEDRVFTEKAFVDEASKKFVLVRLDFPRNRHIQSEKLQEANAKANKAYMVTAYPTVILADSSGRPYARTGWVADLSIEGYLQHLNELYQKHVERDEHFDKAAKADGQDKANHLGAAIKEMRPEVILQFYGEEYRQALAIDPENAGGMRRVVFMEKLKKLKEQLNQLGKKQDWAGILKALVEFREAEGKQVVEKQEIDYLRLGPLLRMERYDELMKLLDSIVAMNKDSRFGKQAAGLKPKLQADIKAAKEAKAKGEKPKPAEKEKKAESLFKVPGSDDKKD